MKLPLICPCSRISELTVGADITRPSRMIARWRLSLTRLGALARGHVLAGQEPKSLPPSLLNENDADGWIGSDRTPLGESLPLSLPKSGDAVVVTWPAASIRTPDSRTSTRQLFRKRSSA